MDTTSKNNTTSNWIIRNTIKTLPWLLLIHNLSYLIFGNPSATSNNTLAFSNTIGMTYLIIIKWAINSGHVSARDVFA
jgi:hypothetical protein